MGSQMKLREKHRKLVHGSIDWELVRVAAAKEAIEDLVWQTVDSQCMISGLKVVNESKRVLGRGLRTEQSLPGLSYMHFRGNVVLSPYNMLDESLPKEILTEANNPGMQPHCHLSSHFTFHGDDPFKSYCFSLQANPYVDDEAMHDSIKAIFANHYCIQCCQGFFANDRRNLPVVVVRPGGAPPGIFGAYYGGHIRTYPCGACGHVCEPPNCLRCVPTERRWLSEWREARKSKAVIKEELELQKLKDAT